MSDALPIYCFNGHLVGVWNAPMRISPGRLQEMLMESAYEEADRLNFCTICGAQTLGDCLNCHLPFDPEERRRPSYCGRCGKPFPWTEGALSAAREYTDDLELTPGEKTELKNTFPDLTVETVRTPLAVSRFKKYMSKIGPVASATLKKMLDIAIDEGVKKLLGLM